MKSGAQGQKGTGAFAVLAIARQGRRSFGPPKTIYTCPLLPLYMVRRPDPPRVLPPLPLPLPTSKNPSTPSFHKTLAFPQASPYPSMCMKLQLTQAPSGRPLLSSRLLRIERGRPGRPARLFLVHKGMYARRHTLLLLLSAGSTRDEERRVHQSKGGNKPPYASLPKPSAPEQTRCGRLVAIRHRHTLNNDSTQHREL